MLQEHIYEQPISVDAWLPTLRNPEDLYLAYSGKEKELSDIARTSAIEDLSMLPIPEKLARKDFESLVGIILIQMPIIHQVDTFVVIPQRFGAVRDLLSSLPCANNPEFDADRAWQTLMRWLRHFLTTRYKLSVPHYSEIFCRVEDA
jgi:hypothetical protein